MSACPRAAAGDSEHVQLLSAPLPAGDVFYGEAEFKVTVPQSATSDLNSSTVSG
jgi:hypothetical protein